MKWLIGLAAGAAVLYYLKSDKGKAMMESIKNETGSLGDFLTRLKEDLFKKASSAVS